MAIGAIIIGILICFSVFASSGSKSHLFSGCMMLILLALIVGVFGIIAISSMGW